MGGYTKLFSSILASTLWDQPDKTRIVFITMLAMANRDGVVETSIPGLARFARVPLKATQNALETLSSPDKHSRTPDHEGRRIEAVPGGFKILNYELYRWKMDRDDLAEKNAERQRRYRRRNARNVTVTLVTENNDIAESKSINKSINTENQTAPVETFDCSKVELKPATFNSQEMARIVWEKCGLAGQMMLRLVCDCIDLTMKRKGLDAETAGQLIIDRWEAYERMRHSGEIKYAKGTRKFFEEGEYLKEPDKWRSKPEIVKPGQKSNLDELYAES